jgi:phytoene synthase
MTDAAADQAIAEEVTRKSGTSFFLAMRLLPPEKRDAMFAVYAFCREVDDIADEPGDLDAKKQALAEWRGWIDDLYAGRTPASAIARTLVTPIRDYDLKREDFLAVIEGMEFDAKPDIRVQDMDELLFYCDRVACAVGRLSVRIFGMPEKDGIALAKAEGLALQLTNILRDIAEDAEIDRVYLPMDRLRSAGLTGDTPAELVTHPGIENVCREIATRAADCYAEAEAILARSDRKAVRPARIMLAVYGEIFRRLRKRGWNPSALDRPVGPGKADKLWIALKAGYL